MENRVIVLLVLLILSYLAECRNVKDLDFPKPTKSSSRSRQGRQHYRRLGKDSVKNNDNILENSEKDCHKEALRWCGRSFTKVFKLLPFLSGKQAFKAKCVLREAFFSCLDKVKEKPCKKSRKMYKDDNFRRKLADKLWSTRVCVLGLKDDSIRK